MPETAPKLPPDTPATIVEFFGHWLALYRERLPPTLGAYLDRAPPRLQPYVMITDVSATAPMRVRLMGTGITDLIGMDATGKTIDNYYSPDMRAYVAQAVREVVTRPAGFLCIRKVRTLSGPTLSTPSICLPLCNPSFKGGTIITFTHIDKALADFAVRVTVSPVQDLTVTHWIDLGAGVPA